MKKVIILHGAGETPQSFWHPFIKRTLESKGISVSVPQLPAADKPDLEKWLPFVLENENINKETILLSHSAGGPLVLALLESIKFKINKAIIVAGYSTTLSVKGAANGVLKNTYDWPKIKNNVKDLIFINSDNDPWGCDDKQGRKMFDKLGGMLIINHEGHMGSDWMKQPYREFPLLIKLIEL